MNAKEAKTNLENIIKKSVEEFEDNTGLKIKWVEIIRSKSTGFKVDRDIKINAIIKND